MPRHPHTATLGLLGLLVFLVGCAPLAAIAPLTAPSTAPSGVKESASNELTIIYTGYGRGSVDPASPCG